MAVRHRADRPVGTPVMAESVAPAATGPPGTRTSRARVATGRAPRAAPGPDPLARRPDDPRGERRPAQQRWREGRRTPELERVRRFDPDRAVLPLAPARRPRRGEAARESRLPRDPVPDGQSRRELPDAPARVRGPAVLPEPHQGPRPGRLLDGQRRPGSGRAAVREPCRSISAPSPRRGRPSLARPPVRGTRRRRGARRGFGLGSGRRGRAQRSRQRHDDRGPESAEPRPRHPRHSGPTDRGLFRRGRLAGRGGEVRSAAPGAVREAGRSGAPPADRRHGERGIPGHDPEVGRRGPLSAHRPGAGGLPRRPAPVPSHRCPDDGAAAHARRSRRPRLRRARARA